MAGESNGKVLSISGFIRWAKAQGPGATDTYEYCEKGKRTWTQAVLNQTSFPASYLVTLRFRIPQ